MNYIDKIKSLNNLQFCHFLNEIGGDLELVAAALERADNPEIYCSDDNFCTAVPNKPSDRYYDSTIYWHRCLSKDFDNAMRKIREKDSDLKKIL